MIVRDSYSIFVLQIVFVNALRHEKPVAELIWQGRCTTNKYALNDCNWCTCNKKHQYTCKARACDEVDMFGHFNDAIRDINVGMEGHGVWRSAVSSCEPGVHYRRADLFCVCDENGKWPNPVCRDIFRVLHSVEITRASETKHQTCSPTKLYLIGCNVCFCPSKGRIDPEMCTQRKCVDNDPAVKDNDEASEEAIENNLTDNYDVYAQCRPDHRYKLGCRTCICLRNNRLHCDNCTSKDVIRTVKSYCSNVKPGHLFSRDCNLCYCDKNGYSYCTVKKCLAASKNGSIRKFNSIDFNTDSCTPGNYYMKDCNTCTCIEKDGKKVFGCTLKLCARTTDTKELIHLDCVANTVYELNCLICSCYVIDGIKKEFCVVNPKCNEKSGVNDLNTLHGYCEPLHNYTKDCNECMCLSDGKTVMCTSRICDKLSQQPITVDIVPVVQKGETCPNGQSYKIDCNYCFCLPNGNALCTTTDCKI